jgi:hypothetical protein
VVGWHGGSVEYALISSVRGIQARRLVNRGLGASWVLRPGCVPDFEKRLAAGPPKPAPGRLKAIEAQIPDEITAMQGVLISDLRQNLGKRATILGWPIALLGLWHQASADFMIVPCILLRKMDNVVSGFGTAIELGRFGEPHIPVLVNPLASTFPASHRLRGSKVGRICWVIAFSLLL